MTARSRAVDRANAFKFYYRVESWGDGYGQTAGELATEYGAVKKQEKDYALTVEGRQFVENAVEAWADTTWTPATSD